MKTFFPLIILFFLIGEMAFAQEDLPQYNKWSIDFGGGMQIASRPYAPGFAGNDPSFFQASAGVRHMFNERFGLRGVLGYNSIKENDGSTSFKADYMRITAEGVVNVADILKFSDWTQSFGLLFHSGFGYSNLSADQRPEDADSDHMANVTAGITPQVKVSDRFALFLDVTLIGHPGFNSTWEGSQEIISTERRIDDGLLYNMSVGLSYYLGNEYDHIDWHVVENTDLLKSKIEELEERLAKIETDLIDTDQDGVLDYLDREPNTYSGVAVNTKGIAVDKNENGIPDEIESSLDTRYVNQTADGKSTMHAATVKDLLNKGYVNVYFKFNSLKPQLYSYEAINYLKIYMKENPSATAELIGYADEIGDATYNSDLSERRAKKVYDILVASGISADRLSYRGNGEDNTVDTSSIEARQLVRRVTFKLKG